MSTIVRSSSASRSGRSGRAARDSQRPLTGRALRVRNACVCRAAAQLGLAMPTDAELRDIPDGANLREAVDWWRARAPGAVEASNSRRGLSPVLRTAVVVGVTLIGLAFSYGQAQ